MQKSYFLTLYFFEGNFGFYLSQKFTKYIMSKRVTSINSHGTVVSCITCKVGIPGSKPQMAMSKLTLSVRSRGFGAKLVLNTDS
jgi:hypothetical protein